MGLSIIYCGEVITYQKRWVGLQLDLLVKRGTENGAKVDLTDRISFKEMALDGHINTGKPILNLSTCADSPLIVIKRFREKLVKRGVNFRVSEKGWLRGAKSGFIVFSNRCSHFPEFTFNCAGLQADRVAHKFGLCKQYAILPFNVSYWQLKKSAPFGYGNNRYPVPELGVPSLDIHATPKFGGTTYLGLTAIPASGARQLCGLEGVEPTVALDFAWHTTEQILIDKKMRRYTFDQTLEWMPHKFVAAMRVLARTLSVEQIEKSSKAGSRPQFYEFKSKSLVQDFRMIEQGSSAQVTNSISPAFTASFALSDHIIETSTYFKKGTIYGC